MPNCLKQRDVIAINDFTKNELLHIISVANQFKLNQYPQLLKGHILGSCFFEPSTRTRLSFDAAMQRLGGSVIGFSDVESTSIKKGESLSDSMKMMAHYADVIVIRHPLEGAAQLAAEAVDIPIINAGDGSHQHPSQTFLDLFSIQDSQNRLDELRIGIAGDLKYGRAAHSLAQALSHFNSRLYLISPQSLEMPKDICDELKEKRIKFSFHYAYEEVIDKLDILYVTRIQQERFSHKMDFDRLKNALILHKKNLNHVKSNFKILHPLPRVNEIEPSIDQTPYAYYFTQAQNGLYVRQALLSLVLGYL